MNKILIIASIIFPLFAFSQESIDSFEMIELGGVKQRVWIRGNDINKPLILFLHGGPGDPHMHEAGVEVNPLKKDFVAVHWDQRGSGDSYSKKVDPSTLTIEQLIRDTHELISKLLKRFGKRKLTLVGHSWGTFLGFQIAKKYPELLHSFVPVGIAVDPIDGLKNIQQRVIEEARRMKAAGENWTPEKEEALRKIESVNLDKMYSDKSTFFEKFMNDFSGPRHLFGLRWVRDFSNYREVLNRPEYQNPHFSDPERIKEYRRIKGPSWELNQGLFMEVCHRKLSVEVTSVEVPVFAIHGRHDANVDPVLGIEFMERLQAPVKKSYVFEHSGHMMQFEEPERFQEIVLKDALPIAIKSEKNLPRIGKGVRGRGRRGGTGLCKNVISGG